MSTNASNRRRISSCNDLGESLLHAHSDAHVLPAVQDTLDRVRKCACTQVDMFIGKYHCLFCIL